LLKELEPGLLINTGHYRNGILLAPSCAEWIGLKIENKSILN
jgi:glycine/D-amino acid oxidase-like deaminating enzyme